MKTSLITAGIVLGFAASLSAQYVSLNNIANTGGFGAQTNGRVFMSGGQLFDGLNCNLGVTVSGGPAPNNLGAVGLGTYRVTNDPKAYTGFGPGTFQLGDGAVCIPGVASDATAYLRLQIWYDGVSGLYPSYAAAVAAGAPTAEVLFQNPTRNLPSPPPALVGMPSILLGLGDPPFLIQHPQSQAAVRGATVQFTAVAMALYGVTFQWRFNGTNFGSPTTYPPDAMSAMTNVLALANVQPSNAGAYSVVVSNLYGPATSTDAFLTVLDPPVAPTLWPPALAGAQFSFTLTGPAQFFRLRKP